MLRKVHTALISVSDKAGIVEFAQFLHSSGVRILSTGGTATALRDAEIPVTDVSDVTGFPEIMDGRVKTLHPKVHGGLLGRRDSAEHMAAMTAHDITPIDLVVINLYPFEDTVDQGKDFGTCIENIDIGGPSMIRSSAKNHNDVVVITNPEHYTAVAEEMAENNNCTTLQTRKELAVEAFGLTADYDAAISDWFMDQVYADDILEEEDSVELDDVLLVDGVRKLSLRYGENPHQQAALYVDGSNDVGVAMATQLQGKELSYNNIADTDAAFELVSEFTSAPACAIIKHANPCGVAVGGDIVEAYKKALACDPVSAYGGILAFNQNFTAAMATELGKHFAEVIIAPKFDVGAREILAAKKNLRLLETGSMPSAERAGLMVKSITGGYLVQSRDNFLLNEDELKVVTKRAPTQDELRDLLFAFAVCKHTKSNAIIYAKDGATVGIGAGQMSRVDSARIGAWKARETNEAVSDARGSVLASDAFFPFSDGLISAAENGVTAVIQPGGSIRDEEVIAAADEHNIAMVLTGVRHFRH